MYAIILTGGKQIKANVGDVIFAEKLPVEEGKEVVFDKVLYVEDGKKTYVGKPFVEGASVKAIVKKNGKGKKIHVLRYHAKSNVRVAHGHRQPFTKLEIESIDVK